MGYDRQNSALLDQIDEVTFIKNSGTPVTKELSYDIIGNPTSYYNGDAEWTFTWQNGKQLAAAQKIGSNVEIANTYDVDGIRDSKTVNGVKHTYTTLSGKIIRESYGTKTIDYIYDNQGKPYKLIVKENGNSNGIVGYYALNLQGDVIAIIDSVGNVAVNYEYDAWGREVSKTTSGTNGTTLYNNNRLKYRGYYYDSDLGMYYLGARFYDPAIGRFLNADVIDVISATASSLTEKNLYAYCNNNPIVYRDVTGNSPETVLDIISLAASISEVAENPRDVWAWAGLVGDAMDLIPVLTGVGETIRCFKVATKVDNVIDTSSVVKKGWNLGDDITNLTKAGKAPSWSTVKSRYWKNEALYNSSNYTDSNLALMKKGRAPLVTYIDGKQYPMELHHIVPGRDGGSNSYDNLIAVSPWEHARIDKYRHFKP